MSLPYCKRKWIIDNFIATVCSPFLAQNSKLYIVKIDEKKHFYDDLNVSFIVTNKKLFQYQINYNERIKRGGTIIYQIIVLNYERQILFTRIFNSRKK